VLRPKEWVNKDDKDSRQRERENRRDYIYIYIKRTKWGTFALRKSMEGVSQQKIIWNTDMEAAGLVRPCTG
jgi:hypothetical protein